MSFTHCCILLFHLLAVAVIFYTLGAPLAAALEVIVYAGAIMVMFLFVMMMLNLRSCLLMDQERAWLSPYVWIGPSILAAILLVELLLGLMTTDATMAHTMVEAKEIGIALFGPYVLAVELASMLLLGWFGGRILTWQEENNRLLNELAEY